MRTHPIIDCGDVLRRGHAEHNQRVNLGQHRFRQRGGTLADHRDPQAADSAATHDVLRGAQQTLYAGVGPLRRDFIRFVNDYVMGQAVALIESFEEVGREAATFVLTQHRDVQDRREPALDEDLRDARAHGGCQRRVGVLTAEDDDGQARGLAVGRGPQPVPGTGGVVDRRGYAGLDQTFGKDRSCMCLAAPFLPQNPESRSGSVQGQCEVVCERDRLISSGGHRVDHDSPVTAGRKGHAGYLSMTDPEVAPPKHDACGHHFVRGLSSPHRLSSESDRPGFETAGGPDELPEPLPPLLCAQPRCC